MLLIDVSTSILNYLFSEGKILKLLFLKHTKFVQCHFLISILQANFLIKLIEITANDKNINF